jgi:hypothetical protein
MPSAGRERCKEVEDDDHRAYVGVTAGEGSDALTSGESPLREDDDERVRRLR